MRVLLWFELLCCLAFDSFMVVKAQDMGWVGGNKLADVASTQSCPGGRSGAGVWQDRATGSVWLFGGQGISSGGTEGGGVMLNDAWLHTIHNLSWQQIHPGTQVSSQNAQPPTQIPAQQASTQSSPQSPHVPRELASSSSSLSRSDSAQVPRPRQLPAVCGTGHVLAVFGGLTDQDQALGDLWVLDLRKKVWRLLVEDYQGGNNRGSNDTESTRREGPAPRGDSAYWCTESHMFVFGGVNGSSHIFSDLWRLSLQNFTWHQLPSSKDAPASLRDHTTADYPRGRNGAMTWTTPETPGSGNISLFLFGGNVLSKHPRDRHIATGYSSDLWRYSVDKDSWHFLKGSTQPGQPAIYGYKHQGSSSSVPGCRRGGATWTDSSGMLWLFGGEGADGAVPSDVRSAKLLSDLWRFIPGSSQWVWMSGSQRGDAAAKVKDLGRVAHHAQAGGRVDAAAWSHDTNGFLFFFGGLGHDANMRDGFLSDLWKVDASSVVLGYGFFVPAVYGFAVIFGGVALLLALAVIALYARDRSRDRTKPHSWGARSTRYSQLPDSDN